MWWNGSDKLQIYIDNDGSSWSFNTTGNTTLTLNAWTHIALVRTGNNIRLYINGTLDSAFASSTFSGKLNASSSWVYIAEARTGSGEFKGYVDEYRISTTARYGSFTPATTAFSSDANTKLLMHMDGSDGGTTFTDSSGSAHTITPSGNTHTDTTIKKIGTASAQFDGNGDYLTLADSADWDIGTNWTAEFWAYNSTSVNDTYVLNHSTDANNLWGIKMNTNCSPRFFIQVGGSNTVLINGSENAGRANTCLHYAIVKTGDDWEWYVNGVSDATLTDTSDDPGFSGSLYLSLIHI